MDMLNYKTVLGLDIGLYAVKAVRMTLRGRTPVVTHAETLRQPAGALDWPTVIARWLEQKGLTADPCVIGIRGISTMFQPLILQPEDPRAVGQAVAMEITRLNELSSEAMTYAFIPLPEKNKARRLLLGLARPNVAESALAGPKAAGLNVVDIIPGPVALFSAGQAVAPDTGKPLICADIGHSSTDVAIGTAESLLFARSFSVGGQFFTEALARAKRLTAQQAEPIKTSRGSLAEGDEAVRVALTGVADNWISEFQACLAMYRNFYGDDADKPATLLLSGGGAVLGGLDKYLQERLGIEVRRVTELPGAPALTSPGQYAIAYGLARLGTGCGVSRLSLLPAAMKEDLLLRQQKPYWLAAGAMAMLILGISLLGGYRDFRRMNRDLTSQRESLTRCQELAREIDRIDGASRQIVQMSVVVDQLIRNGPIFRDLIRQIAEKREANIWVTIMSDATSYFSPNNPPARIEQHGRAARPGRKEAQPGPSFPEEKAAFNRVIIEGYTADNTFGSVQKLIADLKSIGYVKSADLLGDEKLVDRPDAENPWARLGYRRFAIDVSLQ